MLLLLHSRLLRRLRKRAFTILELLIVVVVIGILASLAIIQYNRVQEKAYLATLQSDLRNFATAQAIYISENDTYANGVAAAGFNLSQHVSQLSAIGGTGAKWRLSLGHAKSEWRCAMQGGPTAVGPESKSPVCIQGTQITFDVSDASPNAGEVVTFDATNAIAQMAFGAGSERAAAYAAEISEIATVSWSFGDGQTSAGPPSSHRVVTHSYQQAGNYTVTLNLTKVNGDEAAGTKTVSAANKAPTADFSVSQSGLSVVATAAASDEDGDVLTYAWNWGDASTSPASQNQQGTHTYASGGARTITLTVSDGKGGVVTVTKNLTANAAPVASFTFAPSTPEGGDEVTFTSSSTDPEGDDLTYAWDFGFIPNSSGKTGSTATQALPTGTHSVTLTVSDDAGNSTPVTQNITVGTSAAPNVSDPADRAVDPEQVFVESWSVTNPSPQARSIQLDLSVAGSVASAYFQGGSLTTQRASFAAGETKSFSVSGTVSATAAAASQGTIQLLATNTQSSEAASRLQTVTVNSFGRAPSVTAGAELSLAPSATDSLSFQVRNEANDTRTLSFSASSASTSVATAGSPNPASLSFTAGETKTVKVPVTAASNAVANSTASITLQAVDASDAAFLGSAAGTVRISVSALAPTVTAPAQASGNPGETKTASFGVTNHSNAPRTFSFVASSSNSAVVADPADPANVTIAALGSASVEITYVVASGITSGTTSTITLAATDAANAALTDSGSFGFTTGTILASPTVTAASAGVSANPGATGTLAFTVLNNSNTSRTFGFTANSSNLSAVPQPTAPSSITVAAHASSEVTLSYTVASNAQSGATSTVSLSAADTQDSSKNGVASTAVSVNTFLVSPSVTAPVGQSGNPGEAKTATFTMVNNSNTSRTFSFVANSSVTGVVAKPANPANQTVAAGTSASVVVSYTISSTAAAGNTSSISLTASDTGDGTKTASSAFTATVNTVTAAPTVTAPANQSGNPGTTQSSTFQVRNNSNASRTFSFAVSSSNGSAATAGAAPANQTIAAGATANVVVSYTYVSTASSGSTSTITMSATDTGDGTRTASASFTATVNQVLASPTVTAPAGGTYASGSSQTLTFSVKNNSNGSVYFYFEGTSNNTGVATVTSPNPAAQVVAAGATTTVNVSISMGSTAGTASISLKAYDAANPSYQSTASVAVTLANRAPNLTSVSASPNPATSGQAMTSTITATEPDGQTINYYWNWGDGTTTGYQTSSTATHTYASAGTYTITGYAYDGSLQVSTTRSITVNSPAPSGTGLNLYAFYGQNLQNGAYFSEGSVWPLDWTNRNPAGREDDWSIQVSGYIYAPATGNYGFRLESDDGLRMWVNGQDIVSPMTSNNWSSSITVWSATVYLTAGSWYPITIHHYENNSTERLQILWAYPGNGSPGSSGTQIPRIYLNATPQ